MQVSETAARVLFLCLRVNHDPLGQPAGTLMAKRARLYVLIKAATARFPWAWWNARAEL
jgi:hypothetical protein